MLPNRPACTRRFVADARVYALDVDTTVAPGVVVAVLADMEGDVAVAQCHGHHPAIGCVFSPFPPAAFEAGETMTLWGFAHGVGSWVVRALYVS